MKTLPTFENNQYRTIFIVGIIVILLQFVAHFTVWAGETSIRKSDTVKIEMQKLLKSTDFLQRLNFPKSVSRFYELTLQNPNWLRTEQNIGPTASAMLLLDCVRQLGLKREDYHPETLNYLLMHDMLSEKNQIPALQKAEFELFLTDALISVTNNLHYGAANPKITRTTIDNGNLTGLNADLFLQKLKDSDHLRDSILTVQPTLEQYVKLQDYLKLVVGQYACDAYETPETDILTISLNMERLRWINAKSSSYFLVNIPSYQLLYYTPEKTYRYKVVVGKTSTPTPMLESIISHIETAPDWKIPNKIFINEMLPKAIKNNSYFENNHIAVYDQKENFVAINGKSLAQIKLNPTKYHARQTAGCDNALGTVVFRFNNPHSIYLHDTPEKQYFNRPKRALSHGCIRVDSAEKLAALLLEQDGQAGVIPSLKKAISSYSKKNFSFKNQVPIIITYLTATIEDGLLVKHEDIYKLDKQLKSSQK